MAKNKIADLSAATPEFVKEIKQRLEEEEIKGWTLKNEQTGEVKTFPNFSKLILHLFEIYAKLRREMAFDEAWQTLENDLKQNNLLEK